MREYHIRRYGMNKLLSRHWWSFSQNPHENFSIMQKGRKVQMLEVKETIVNHEALNWFIFNIYVYHFLKGVTLFC